MHMLLGVRGRSVHNYTPWEWHPRRPACGLGWRYDPARVALPPPVGRTPDLTDPQGDTPVL